MKKLMLVAAIVCVAITSQAVQVKWGGTLSGVTASAVTDNGNYNVAGVALAGNSTLNYAITFFLAGEEVCSDTGTMSVSALGKGNTTFNSTATADLAKSTEYTYTLVLTGVQNDLQARGKTTDYDYSAATISTTLNGSFTTKSTGITSFTDQNVTSWTVAGIKPVEPTPEPTSAMLLVLGMAGLALRRRRV